MLANAAKWLLGFTVGVALGCVLEFAVDSARSAVARVLDLDDLPTATGKELDALAAHLGATRLAGQCFLESATGTVVVPWVESDAELHDIGVKTAERWAEINKPFWRA